jgi:hypothetical protein
MPQGELIMQLAALLREGTGPWCFTVGLQPELYVVDSSRTKGE